jgi:hypothetical protein
MERLRAAARARSATPEVRARKNARQRERYANDPEYRALRDARTVASARERYANDPEYREHKKALALAYWRATRPRP